MKINGIEVGPFRDLMKILNFWSKALAGRRNHFQGAPSLVSVVTECGGSRKGGGLEVGFSVKKRILAKSRLLTCPGIVGASDRLYYRP